MANATQTVQLSYFGYSTTFLTANSRNADIRAEANRKVLDKFGPSPAVPYVEVSCPFPDYVPVLRFDLESGDFL